MPVAAAAAAESLQSCSTPSNPMDFSLPGSSAHGIFQARVLERGAIAFSKKSNYNPLLYSVITGCRFQSPARLRHFIKIKGKKEQATPP